MFFLLSKVLAFLLKPLNGCIALLLIGLFTKNARRKRYSLRLSIVFLVFFTNPWMVRQCAAWWEIGRLSPSDIKQPFEIGIVLGGYTNFDVASPNGTRTFNRAVNRLNTALGLLETGKVRRLLLTGGSGKMMGQEDPEAAETQRFLRELGIPDSLILVENQSRNTRENAIFTKAALDTLTPGASCLLISSAWHLRRATACFQKAGVSCTPFGTDYYAERNNGNPFRWLEPDWESLMKWNALLKEWVGWWAYRIKGYV